MYWNYQERPMKERLIGFIKTYCLFVCIFALQKPLFMLFYKSLYPDASWADRFNVIWHGLPLDLSLAGYLTAVPGFLFIASAWTLSKFLHRIRCGYFLFVSVLISLIFTVDLGLYEYWGFRLDAVAVDEGAAKGKNLPLGKAYLQKLYDDIAKR